MRRPARARARAGRRGRRSSWSRDAIEIGARVLDREQAGANAEFVKTEFERAVARARTRVHRARRAQVAEHFGEQGRRGVRAGERPARQGPREALLRRLLGVGAEPRARARRRGAGALARGPAAAVLGRRRVEPAGRLQGRHDPRAHRRPRSASTRASRRCCASSPSSRSSCRRCATRRRSSRRSRPSASAAPPRAGPSRSRWPTRSTRSRCARATSPRRWATQRGATGKTGDVVVAIDACHGPARGRVVFEAKDSRLSKPGALRGARRRARRARRRLRACSWCPRDEELPAKLEPLREYNGDKLIVALDPDDPARSPLELGLPAGARARADGARRAEGVDGGAAARHGRAGARRAMEDDAQGQEPAHRREDGHRQAATYRGDGGRWAQLARSTRCGGARWRPDGDARGAGRGRRRRTAADRDARRSSAPAQGSSRSLFELAARRRLSARPAVISCGTAASVPAPHLVAARRQRRWIVRGVGGSIGPTLASTERPPSSVTVCGSSVWLDDRDDAPARRRPSAGDTVTLSLWITPRELDRHRRARLVLEVVVAAARERRGQ